MNKRNFKYNRYGGVDCEIEFGRVRAEEDSPAIDGVWLPHTLEEFPIGVDVAPYVEPNKTKDQLLSMVAAQRYNVKTRGITRSGQRISTDRVTQAMVTGAYQALNSGLIQSTNWKNDDGTFTELTFESLSPLATIIAQHVADCFTAEMGHMNAINALSDQAAINSYDINQGWPI